MKSFCFNENEPSLDANPLDVSTSGFFLLQTRGQFVPGKTRSTRCEQYLYIVFVAQIDEEHAQAATKSMKTDTSFSRVNELRRLL